MGLSASRFAVMQLLGVSDPLGELGRKHSSGTTGTSAEAPPSHGFHKSTRDEGTQAVTRPAEMNPTKH